MVSCLVNKLLIFLMIMLLIFLFHLRNIDNFDVNKYINPNCHNSDYSILRGGKQNKLHCNFNLK